MESEKREKKRERRSSLKRNPVWTIFRQAESKQKKEENKTSISAREALVHCPNRQMEERTATPIARSTVQRPAQGRVHMELHRELHAKLHTELHRSRGSATAPESGLSYKARKCSAEYCQPTVDSIQRKQGEAGESKS